MANGSERVKMTIKGINRIRVERIKEDIIKRLNSEVRPDVSSDDFDMLNCTM